LLAMTGPASAQPSPHTFKIVADNGKCLTKGPADPYWNTLLADCDVQSIVAGWPVEPAMQKFVISVESTNYPFNAGTTIKHAGSGHSLDFGSSTALIGSMSRNLNLTIKAPNDAWHRRADEGGSFTLATQTQVRYGAVVNGQEFFKTLSLPPGSVNCNNATFEDPIVGTVKHCESLADVRANEGGSFTLAAQTQVRYGAVVNGQESFNTLSLPPGAVACNNGTFGEPIYGTVKHCESVGTSTVTISNPNRQCLARRDPTGPFPEYASALPATACLDPEHTPEAARWTLVPAD